MFVNRHEFMKKAAASFLAVLMVLAFMPVLPGAPQKAYAGDELSGLAYAVYLDRRQTVKGTEYPAGTLVFIRVNKVITDATREIKVTSISGETFTGYVYYGNTGIENDDYTVPSTVPWAKKFLSIKKVVFVDKIMPQHTAYWFRICESLTSIDNMENLDTSNTKDMTGMFSGCYSLKSLDLSHMDTSSATSMYKMFSGCSALTGLDLSKFNTSNVQNMSSMFSGCSALTGLDLSKFNTSNVQNMSSMFSGCSALTGLDLSKFNTSNVQNMSSMFAGCSAMTGLDLSKFDTSKVQNMSYMFSDCSSLKGLDLSKFNTSNVQNMSSMFAGCSDLTGLDLSGFDISNVTNMTNMFRGTCSNAKEKCTGIARDKATADKFNDAATDINPDKLKFKVKKSTPSYTVPTGLTAKKGDTLSSVALPAADNGTWSWEDETQSVGEPGEKKFKAKFTPTDTDTYSTVTGIEVPVTVYGAPEITTETLADGTEFEDYSAELSANGDPEPKWAPASEDDRKALEQFGLTLGEDGTISGKAARAGKCTFNAKATNSFGGKNYEDKKSFSIIIKPHTHVMTEIPAAAATCTSDGNMRYYKCGKCGKLFSDIGGTHEITAADAVTPALGHADMQAWQKNADSHWHECSRCHVRTDEAAHVFGDWKVTKRPTSSENGLRERTCTVCGHTETQELPAIHNIYVKKTILNLTARSAGRSSEKLTWTKVKGADGYDIYFAKCGSRLKRRSSVRGLSYVRRGLKPGTAYKYRIVAYRSVGGDRVPIAYSKISHAIAGGCSAKYTDARKVVAGTRSVTMKAGDKKKISLKTLKVRRGRKLLRTSHAPYYRYSSTLPQIAVMKNGVITARKAGTCRIYIYAQNGVRTSVKVTVK